MGFMTEHQLLLQILAQIFGGNDYAVNTSATHQEDHTSVASMVEQG
jgi:hypothetical protein